MRELPVTPGMVYAQYMAPLRSAPEKMTYFSCSRSPPPLPVVNFSRFELSTEQLRSVLQESCLFKSVSSKLSRLRSPFFLPPTIPSVACSHMSARRGTRNMQSRRREGEQRREEEGTANPHTEAHVGGGGRAVTRMLRRFYAGNKTKWSDLTNKFLTFILHVLLIFLNVQKCNS